MITHWHNLAIKEVLEKLGTSVDGLSQEKIKNKAKKYGKNALPKKRVFSRLTIFFSQLKSPLLYILLGAAGVSLVLEEFVDVAVILAAVFVNVIIGYVQERKANQALEHLKKMVERRAWVVRAGKEMNINAEELVPGDVVNLEEGMRVPADGRLLEVNDLEVNEAGLTGESMPVSKEVRAIGKDIVLAERKNMVYMGTLVTRGRGVFVVTETGLNSHFGEIASLVEDTKEDITPLQERISRFSKILGVFILVLSLFIFLLGVFLGLSPGEMFITSVAIAVSSIPEGLPIAITIILAIGMQKMSKKKALTRKMLAAETLGSVSVICTDKTGTLTLGEMRMMHFMTLHGDLISGEGHEGKEKKILDIAFKISALCNNAVIEAPKSQVKDLVVLGDSTEKALLLKAYEFGFKRHNLESEFERLDEIPFDSERKYMATLNKLTKTRQLVLVKGAPEVILKRCSKILNHKGAGAFGVSERAKIRSKLDSLAGQGLRVLALAYKEDTGLDSLSEKDVDNLVFVGLAGLRDPLRESSKDTISLARDAGIRPVIVTGDHMLTAKAIGGEIGLRIDKENVLEGKDIENLTDAELREKIVDIDIFARVLPKHKLRIIDAWQKRGEVVAMTGDGVNDAPAIKSADIGIALGSGSDVSKETSDMVLLDDNFKTIISAVEQGRIIFDNIRKVLVYLLSDSFSEVILISGALAVGLPLPVTAAQILWINLVNDSFPSLALAFDGGDSTVMKQKPRRRTTPILNSEMKAIILIVGLVMDLFLLGIFYFVWRVTGDLFYSRTITFVGLGIGSLFVVYAARSLRKSIWHMHFWNNNLLNLSVLVGLIMLVGAVHIPFLQNAFKVVPLGVSEWGLLLGFGMINLILIELVKWVFIHRRRVV